MNFLFTTVLVLLIVAPGLIFFRSYYSGKFSLQYSKLTLTDQIFQSIIPSIAIHLLVAWLTDRWGPFRLRFDLMGILLMGANDDKTVQLVFEFLRKSLGWILLYHLSLWIIAGISGWRLRRLVRRKGWDRKLPWLRYGNFWHYLLTGEVLEMRDISGNTTLIDARHLDFIFVDVVVKLQEASMLYSGVLSDYELGSDGGLKCIYMKGARRKILNTKPPKGQTEIDEQTPGQTNVSPVTVERSQTMPDPYYEILGDLLVIPYEQMLNINFTYYIDEADAATEGDSEPNGSIEVKAEGK